MMEDDCLLNEWFLWFLLYLIGLQYHYLILLLSWFPNDSMITNHHRNTFKLVILLFIIDVFVQNRRYPQKLLWCQNVLGFSERWMFGCSVAFPDFSASRFEGHITISELQHFPLEVDGSATLRDEGFDGKYHEIICIYFVYYIIYLENHKDKIFCPHGFGHFFCPLHVFFKYDHVRLQTLYLQVNLDNNFPELLDLSDWFRQYECLV